MRDGKDTAICFDEPQIVYEAYYDFVPARRMGLRIKESRARSLSGWDQQVFSLMGYSLSEDEFEDEETFDPFGMVFATAERNFFQEFWEYISPRLSNLEKDKLMAALRRYHEGRPWQRDLVHPSDLTRQVK